MPRHPHSSSESVVPYTQQSPPETSEHTEQMMQKYDKESAYRKKIGKWALVVSFLAISLTLFHLYTATFGGIRQSQVQGAIHLGTALGLIYLLYPLKRGWLGRSGIPWYDIVLALLALGAAYYYAFFVNDINVRIPRGQATELDLFVAVTGVLLVLEATRRCVGLPIVIIAILFMLYAMFGSYMPIFSHRGMSWEMLSTRLFMTTSGIFGTPIQVSSQFIFLFLFFGVVLVRTGIGQFFNDLAFAVAGRFTGGTAKAAVTASALQGTVTGSSVANTVSSGSFTIPLMKKSGFKPEFSAAAEASASTGGQLMPPIMGAAAFLLAEYTGTPYSHVMLAAIIPAVLYFSGVFIGIHFESKRLGIQGLAKSQLPNFKQAILKRMYLILPLIVIFYTLLSGYTPMRAAIYGIVTAFIVSLLRKDTRLTIRDVIQTFEEGARVALPVIAACATAGIVAGIVVITGLGGKIAASILTMSGGILLLTLFFTMIACLLLGMGLPTTANYIVTASVAAPAIILLGEQSSIFIPILAAHMFVFYFGIVADITPPVCLAAYAGSGIARSNPFKTGVTALKLAAAAYIIPYVIVLNPKIVLEGDFTIASLSFAVLTAIVGMIGVASSMMGYFVRLTTKWERMLLFAGGIMLIFPQFWIDAFGFGCIVVVYFSQYTNKSTPNHHRSSV